MAHWESLSRSYDGFLAGPRSLSLSSRCLRDDEAAERQRCVHARPLILQLDEEEEAPVQVATLISGTAITDAALEPARALMAARRRGE